MSRRAVEIGSLLIAVAALAIVLVNATLIDRRAPSIASVALSASAGDPRVAQALSAIDVTFSEQVVASSVEDRFRIEPRVAGAFTWNGATMIFTPSKRLPADTEFTVTIDPGFVDPAGNAATVGLEPWAFRTIGPPLVTASDPADAAVGVPVDGPLALTFDRLMDTVAVESAIRVQPAAAYRASWGGRILTITFDGPLAFGTEYTVTVGTEAADTDGSRLAAPFEMAFTTVAAGLGVERLVPRPDVAGASIRSPIGIVFDAPIDPASIADAIRITPEVTGQFQVVDLPPDDGSRPVPPEVAAGGRVLVFTPSSPLAPHTTYSVTLDPVVSRLDRPGEVAPGRTWSFTTGQPATSAQNQVAFLSARSGARNLWLMNPDGSNPRQITSELVAVSGYDVALVTSRIAYAAGGVVKLMTIDGSEVRELTAPGVIESAPLFTPDGRYVVVGRRDAGGADMGYWLVPVPGVGQGEERQLVATGAPEPGVGPVESDGLTADGSTPAWLRRGAIDPDATRLLVVTGSGAVVLVDLAADPPPDPATVAPLDGLGAASAPVWDPGSGAFLLVTDGPAGSVLRIVRTDGTTAELFPAVGSIALAQSGVGVTLVRESASGPAHVARVTTFDGTAPVPLTTSTELADGSPTFAPDGRTILFARVRPETPERSTGIWSVGADGLELHQLSTDGAWPRWLP